MSEIPFQNSVTSDQILKSGVYIGGLSDIKEIISRKGPMMIFKFYTFGGERYINGFCNGNISTPSYELCRWLSILNGGDIDLIQELNFGSFYGKAVKLVIGRYIKDRVERNVVKDLIGLATESEMNTLISELERQQEEHIQKIVENRQLINIK
jgi:hypothetical protein